MKRLLVSFVLSLLYVHPACAEPKINKEKHGLLGSVQKVVTETAKLADRFGNWEEGTRTPSEAVSFDAQGNLTEEDSYSPDGTLRSKAVYTYDTKENRAEEVFYKPRWRFFDGPVDSKDVYSYDAKGNLTEEASYSPDGTLKSKTTCTYDAKGNKTEEAFYNPNLRKKEVYTYENDAFGNWIKMVTSTWVTKFGKSYFEPSMVTYRTITYY